MKWLNVQDVNWKLLILHMNGIMTVFMLKDMIAVNVIKPLKFIIGKRMEILVIVFDEYKISMRSFKIHTN